VPIGYSTEIENNQIPGKAAIAASVRALVEA